MQKTKCRFYIALECQTCVPRCVKRTATIITAVVHNGMKEVIGKKRHKLFMSRRPALVAVGATDRAEPERVFWGPGGEVN